MSVRHSPIKLLLLIAAALALPISAQADSLTKLSEVKRGEISKLSIVPLFPTDTPGAVPGFDPNAALPSSDFVTAVRDSQNKLGLLHWTVDPAGEARVVLPTFATDGTIKDVVATEIHRCSGDFAETKVGCFVTALRDSDDRLRLISWFVGSDGSIERGGTAVGPSIREVAAGSIVGQFVFIAARDFDGNLLIQTYGVGGSTVARFPNEWTYGTASRISVTTGSGNAVAMRDGENRLRLIHFWNAPSHGIRAGTTRGWKISDVRIARNRTSSASRPEVFTFSIAEGPTGVRTGAGCLSGRLLIDHGLGKIIGWRLPSQNQQGELERTREKQLEDFGGIAKKADLLFLRAGQNRLVTGHLGFDNFCRALRKDQGKPRLQLTVWDTASRSDAFVKVADAHLGGDYTDIAMTEIAGSGNQKRFVVALRGVRGELKVTVWGLTP